jgi:hypothetical protein
MMKKIFLTAIIAVIATIAFVFNACESKTYDDISEKAENPTYSKNVGPLISNTCTGCHSNDSQYPNLENYADVKDAIENGNLICRIDKPSDCNGNIMPQQGRMPQSSIDMVKLWRDQGFVN